MSSEYTEVVVAVDFECLRQNMWSTFAVVVIGVRSSEERLDMLWCFSVGQKEEQLKFQSKQTKDQTSAFWHKHRHAYEYNRIVNLMSDRKRAEISIVSNIDFIRNKWTNFKMICDNPAMDIRLLDNILIAHGTSPISIRPPDNKYLQVICSWSYRLAVSSILNLSKSRIRDESYRMAADFFGSSILHDPALPHTPVYDCVLILCNYIYVTRCIKKCEKLEGRRAVPHQMRIH